MTQQEHEEWIKVTCTMANLQDAIDEILSVRDDLDVYWWGIMEREFNGNE